MLDKAKDIGAIPYDITGAEYPITPTSVHLISFLKNISCLTPLFFNGKIVRGADTDRFDLAPQAAGLWAISAGLSYNSTDDQEQLLVGLKIYDALYSWAKCTRGKTYLEFN